MKYIFLIILSLLVLSCQLFSQADTGTVYKDLEARKFYSVSYFTNGSRFEINGKTVSKSTYDKYKATWENMETCCPCILKSYDENDLLLSETVACTDCAVGSFKTFYPNGKVKLSGRYKENPTGDWNNIWARGYCSVPDGEWNYFNEKGDTLYSEFWNDGNFIKQIPEQKTNEIWKVELTLKGESIQHKILTQEEVRQLAVTLKFKNSAPVDTNITIKFQASATGYRQNEKTFTRTSFQTINILSILSEVGIPSDQKTSYNLKVCNKGEVIGSFYFEVNL